MTNLNFRAFLGNAFSIFLFILAVSTPVRGQVVFSSLSPVSGPSGTEVALAGSGFPTSGVLTISVGGVAAPIIERRSDLIRFSIPAAATTGLVKVFANGVEYNVQTSFTVTRLVTAQIAPELNITAANYFVGTAYNDAPGTGPNYAVEVAKGESTLVAASAEEADPVLMAVVTDADSSVVLSARSTALALLFTTPGVSALTSQEGIARLNFFASRPELTALANAIQTRVAADQDYLGVPEVESPMIALLQAFANEYRPASPAGLAQQQRQNIRDDFVNGVQALSTGFPRDLEARGYEKLRKVVTSYEGTGVNDRGLPVIKVKVKSAPTTIEELREFVDANPLDWMANLYELSPADVDLNSLEKVRNLRGDFANVYDRVTPVPLDRLHVKAKLAFRFLDVPELATDQLMAFLSPALVAKEHLEVPADRPGLYMIRAFSGARFDPQTGLISNLPGGQREANMMRALNLVLAVQEGLGTFAKEALGGDCFNKYLISLLVSVMGAVERETAQGTLSAETMSRLFLHAAKAHVKDYILKCLIFNKDRKGISKMGKVFNSNISLAGKIASFGKIAERVNALGNLVGSSGEPQRIWTAQAMEDTIIVVGNPWQPRISGFFPQSAYRGGLVRIDGRHFAAATNQNIVTFGLLTTDPTNPPVAARAEVLLASPSSLVVRVPEQALDGVIAVTVLGKGSATTVDLDPPFRVFTVLPDPVITGITPNPPVAGQVMQIHGANFAPLADRQELVFGSGVTQAVYGSPNLVVIRTPNSTAANSVKVRIRGRESNVLPFTPVLPSVISTGATIYVSTPADTIGADGDISLREAILLANGGIDALGHNLTSPPDPRPPDVTYETDFVTIAAGGGMPGAATKDFIRAHSKVFGTNVAASSLPTVESFDDYDLRFKLTGGGGDGIRIIGSRVQFRADTIRNFAGHGLVLSGNASHNYIYSTRVENCGGDGFRLEGNAFGNTLYNLLATGCGQGLHLSGPNVVFNRAEGESYIYSEFTANRNFGVLIDGGASFNDLSLWSVNSNGSGGIRITGPDTVRNILQRPNEFPRVARTGVGHIYDNGGPGVWINAPSNIIHGFNIRGNAGDGILIEDPICRGVSIRVVRVGFNDEIYPGAPDPNEGSGLHIRNGARDIIIGLPDAGMSGVDWVSSLATFYNFFSGNRDHGIWIEGAGTSNILVNLTHMGSPMPNGTNGIAITGNAHSVTIGGVDQADVSGGNVNISSHTNGAGIFLAQTTNNLIVGCSLGFNLNGGGSQSFGNKYGIHLTQGAFANVIGVRGTQQIMQVSFNFRIFDSQNHIFGNKEAGILLESGGDPTRTIVPGVVPTGGNVIQNNLFGDSRTTAPNKVGILIRQNAILNRIGGTEPGEGNIFDSNVEAGILIDGAVIGRSFVANRIIGNSFFHQGGFFSGDLGNPLAALTTGVAVALVNGASGHVIGGENPGEANHIFDNYVGIQMVQSSSNQVIGNIIERNRVAGIVLLQSADNTIGPFNEVYRNATRTNGHGGIILKESPGNSVLGNWIGLPKTNVVSHGNKDYGIALLDSSENLLGDFGGQNVIYGPTNGILISGASSFGNQVAHNYIGITPGPPFFQLPNRIAGVVLANGAHDNLIGGERPVKIGAGFVLSPAPNYIQRNSVDGVRVDGAGTVGNSILYNSISDHLGGLGIQNMNGGNTEIPPPTLVSSDGVNVVGSVHASIPNGSRVQFYSDGADEGRNFIGESLVAGGRFQFVIPGVAGSRINATVTDAFFGDTSEFAPLVIHTNNGAGLLVQRVVQPRATNSLPVPGAMGVAVAFQLRAIANPVLVSSITFSTTGTANESAPGTQAYLFRDEDRNGQLGQDDFLLSGPRTFNTNNANLVFSSLGRVIDPGADQDWLVVVLPAINAVVGQTFSFEVSSQTFMTSRVLMTGETITESGEFPLLTDTLVVSGAAAPSGLAIGRTAAGELTIQWTGQALLESAFDVTGPWQLIPDASPPFSIFPTEPGQFFRFRP